MPKSLGDRVAAEARTWIGTPFHWQASLEGSGCDCKGLLWGIARELNRPEAASIYANMADYGPRFDGKLLKEGIAALFNPAVGMKPGDVLLCKWNGQPGHIAIYVGNERAVSAVPGAGVKERPLRALFHKFPLDSVWRWRRR